MSKKSLRQIRRIEAKADKEMSYKSWAKSKSFAKNASESEVLPKDEMVNLQVARTSCVTLWHHADVNHCDNACVFFR